MSKSEHTIRNDAAWSYETARFFIGFYAEEEDTSPEKAMEFDDQIEFAKSGDPGAWFYARVSVYLKDENPYDWTELGRDGLGGCSYNSVEEFYTAWRTSPDEYRNTLANKDKKIVICHYFPDMVRTAIMQARKELAHMADISAIMRAEAGEG